MQHLAFTVKYNGIARELSSPVSIRQSEIIDANNHKSIYENIKAVWDTGATGTCISNLVKTNLNLIPIATESIHTPNSTSIVDVCLVDIFLPNKVIISNVRVFVVDNLNNCNILIGMDIIGLGNFFVSNEKNNTVFSFMLPPLYEHFDLVKKATLLNNQNANIRPIKTNKKKKR